MISASVFACAHFKNHIKDSTFRKNSSFEAAVFLLWWEGVELLLLYMLMKAQFFFDYYNNAASIAQSSYLSLLKQVEEQSHVYSTLTKSSLYSMPPPSSQLSKLCHPHPTPTTYTHHHHYLHHPHSSPPLLHCTQTQRDASCNHCWKQFQGQFEDYLLSLVNKKKYRLQAFSGCSFETY